MLHTPIYDPNKSYEENYKEGPFGAFANPEVYEQKNEPTYSFFNNPVYLPLGVPAGPLVNSKFVKAALQMGFDLPVYKTVRTKQHVSHPIPNILPLDINGDLTLEKAAEGVTAKDNYSDNLAITNSFGVPSFDPDVWQPDMSEAVKAAGKGQVVIGSFQGTNRGEGVEAFIQDHITAAKLVKETGAKVMEVNLSCPNEGTTNLLCFDKERVIKIIHAIKNEIGNIPLLIKLAYFTDKQFLHNYVKEVGTIVDGFATINTIQAVIQDKDGKQALPGEGRLRSGICGAPIKWAGVEMVKELKKLRKEFGMKYSIVGVGGVLNAQDYTEYMNAGADAAMSATGMMWNPYLAQEIKEKVL